MLKQLGYSCDFAVRLALTSKEELGRLFSTGQVFVELAQPRLPSQ